MASEEIEVLPTSQSQFLTVEGIEGVGKSTAVQFIQTYLTRRHIAFILTREPGGTPIAEQVRTILLTPNAAERMVPETELLLMFASRVQHITQVIKPALKAGKWVVSDRFVDASFAYQGGGRGISMQKIQMLEDWLVQEMRPHCTILLDAPPEVGLSRAKSRGQYDRIEQEKIDFHARVRQAYLQRAEQDKDRFRIIDATQSLEKVQEALGKILNALIE